MSDRFEKSISEWYSKVRTIDLEYLDLTTIKRPSTSDLGNNLGIVYNQINLLSRVSLKHFHSLKEENKALKSEIARLRASVSNLETELVSYKPLSKGEVKTLVAEIIINQPNKEASRLSAELRSSTRKVEKLLEEVKTLISG